MSITTDVLDDSAMSTAAAASAGETFSYLRFPIFCTSRTGFGFTHTLVRFAPLAKSNLKECDAAGIRFPGQCFKLNSKLLTARVPLYCNSANDKERF